jgi:hypothetical protein
VPHPHRFCKGAALGFTYRRNEAARPFLYSPRSKTHLLQAAPTPFLPQAAYPILAASRQIQAARAVQQGAEELETLALEGLNSGAPLQIGPEFWQEKHLRLDERLSNNSKP